jgi:hypothetical protein
MVAWLLDIDDHWSSDFYLCVVQGDDIQSMHG